MLALRLSYAGELGWEFHIPKASVLPVYEALSSEGAVNYGSFAMNVMRMEKMFKGAGELTNEVTLPEADVMRFVKMDKEGWLGREATMAALEKPLRYVCKYLVIEADGKADGNGGEAVLMDGKVVGSVSSIVYSPTVDKVLAFAFIKPGGGKRWSGPRGHHHERTPQSGGE